MNNNSPLVSVILPSYNGEKYLREAIESVLNQSFKDFELILINDGSTDKTPEILDEYQTRDSRIKVIHQENIGLAKSLNKGIRLARGKYIARIDDDDEWIDADKIKKQVEFLDKNPDYVLIGTWAIIKTRESLINWEKPLKDGEIRKKILGKNCFIHSSVMFRKESALKVKGYDESTLCRHIEDYDLWLKLGTVGNFANLPTYSVKITQWEGQISQRNKLEQLKKNLLLAKKYKNFYPNYLQSIIRNYLRVLIFGYLWKK